MQPDWVISSWIINEFKKTNAMCISHVHGITLAKSKGHLAPEGKSISANTKHCAKGSNVEKHVWILNHTIYFDHATTIDKENHRTRKTLESWHTVKSVEAVNSSCPLPKQYSILWTNISFSTFSMQLITLHISIRFISSHIFIRRRQWRLTVQSLYSFLKSFLPENAFICCLLWILLSDHRYF